MPLVSGRSSDFRSYLARIVASACFEYLPHSSAWSSKNFLALFTVLSFLVFIPSIHFADAKPARDLPNLNNRLGIPTLPLPPCLTRDLTAAIIASQCKGSVKLA